jgi:alpha-tubulin suppressor-like RCC1 family protein
VDWRGHGGHRRELSVNARHVAALALLGGCNAISGVGKYHADASSDTTPEACGIPDDDNDCTSDTCVGMTPTFTPVKAGSVCATGSCDGKGMCVACTSNADCMPPKVCAANQCVDPTCADGMLGAGELDVDCGGKCPPCGPGKKCVAHLDCASELCSASKCADIVDVAAGNSHACARLGDGRVACWGSNNHCQLADAAKGFKTQPVFLSLPEPALAVALGRPDADGDGAHTVVLLAQAGILCAGSNDDGQCGNTAKSDVCSFLPATGVPGEVAAIAAGGAHTCAIVKPNGVLYCWGANNAGQLGDGGTTPHNTATKVAGIPAVSSVALGATFSSALDTVGTPWIWGNGSYGQIGNGSNTTAVKLPTNPTALTKVSMLRAGGDFAMAVDATNVKAWGANYFLELGIANDKSDKKTPTPNALAGVAEIALGASDTVCTNYDDSQGKCLQHSSPGGHGCAVIAATGALQCWGRNDSGQLGLGLTGNALPPTFVPKLSGKVVQVALGTNFGCARLESGALRCWGANKYGQTGTGSATEKVPVPTAVSWP